MVTSDDFVEMPPDAFDRIGLRGVLGQVVHDDAVSPALQVLANPLTVVERRIVADHMNSLEAAQPAAQVVQVSHEQLGVSPLGRR